MVLRRKRKNPQRPPVPPQPIHECQLLAPVAAIHQGRWGTAQLCGDDQCPRARMRPRNAALDFEVAKSELEFLS